MKLKDKARLGVYGKVQQSVGRVVEDLIGRASLKT